MKQMSWDDLRLLLLIAEYESLNKASIASEISAANLGRRLLGLEQVLGQELFHRSNTGYVMTPFGQKIVHHAKQMQFAADQIIKMCGESKVRPNIRISAGSGTSRFLMSRLNQICPSGADYSVKFVNTEVTLDVAHRECDLAIRNQMPRGNNLACRKLGHVAFGVFSRRDVAQYQRLGWCVVASENSRHPASRWVHSLQESISATSSNVDGVYELVRAGQGKAVFPNYVADLHPELVQISEPLSHLEEDVYLVMHNDDRHRPTMRKAINRIVELFASSALG